MSHPILAWVMMPDSFHLSRSIIMSSKSTITTSAVLALTGVITVQTSALAETYSAICQDSGCSVSVTSKGIGVNGQTIPPHRVTSWFMGGKSETDFVTGAATTFLFGGLGLLGFTAKKHDYNFSISGYNEDGKKTNLSFRFINDKPAKKLAGRLPSLTGLTINETRTLDEIIAYEKGETIPEPVLGRVKPNINDLPSGLDKAGKVSPEPKNCWSDYIEKKPDMKIWADANPDAAAKVKQRFDDC